MFSGSPPTPATLDAITRDAMVEFHRGRFMPDHALIAFAGDITMPRAGRSSRTGPLHTRRIGMAEKADSAR